MIRRLLSTALTCLFIILLATCAGKPPAPPSAETPEAVPEPAENPPEETMLPANPLESPPAPSEKVPKVPPEPAENPPEETMLPANPLESPPEPSEKVPKMPPEPAENPPEETALTANPLESPLALEAQSPKRILDEPGEFTITLEGQGWVFRSDLSTPGDWRFINRERAGESTRFNFLVENIGKWNFVFDRQDLSNGANERTVRRIVAGEDREVLESSDQMEQGDEDLNTVTEKAESGIEKSNETVDRNALIREAAQTGNTSVLNTWLSEYLDDEPEADVLPLILNILEESAGFEQQFLDVLEILLGLPDHPRRPEWLYKMASYLEKPGDSRDIDRALRLYREVVKDWPLSEWRDSSENRINWIERYYIRVR